MLKPLRAYHLFPLAIAASPLLLGCQPFIQTANSILLRISQSVTSSTTASSSTATTATFTPPSGSGFTSFTVDLGEGYQATNICSPATIFGLAGTASCPVSGSSTMVSISVSLQSNVHRYKTTTQVSQADEVTLYAGVALPSGYRDIPIISSDNEGNSGNVTYASRPGSNCGTSGSIETRISDCASVIGTGATWDGATKGHQGQSTWKLVTRSAASSEVWQDQRTGLLWSSHVAASGTINWCQAAGNAEAADTDNYCNNVTYQPNYSSDGNIARSACAETGTIPAIASEAVSTTLGNAWSGTYSAKKGGMGLQTSPSVRWRLPTRNDYAQAEIDGIRFVMPDAASEWTASFLSSGRSLAWRFSGANGFFSRDSNRGINYATRCVGR